MVEWWHPIIDTSIMCIMLLTCQHWWFYYVFGPFLTHKLFMVNLTGGCCSLPSRCLWQGPVCRVKEGTGCTPLRWVIGHCPFSCAREQDRHSICCVRGGAKVPLRFKQLHNRQGQCKPCRLQCSSSRGFYVQHCS